MFLCHTQEECITAALECFKTELNGTVKAECEDPEEVIDQAIEFLEVEIKKRSGNVNCNVSISPHCVGKSRANGKDNNMKCVRIH